MKVTFTYEKEKDIWCLLNFGKASGNSSFATKEYIEFTKEEGENLNTEKISHFIDTYIEKNKLNINSYIVEYQKDWDTVAETYNTIAERVFGITLNNDVTAYISINSRCPYNISENYFLVAMPSYSARKTAMHELWHFYTWYKFGITWEEKIGKQKYNDIKEALTVLLNSECKEILPEGIVDRGYPQHEVLREKILDLWKENKSIEYVWTEVVKELD